MGAWEIINHFKKWEGERKLAQADRKFGKEVKLNMQV